MSKVTYKLGATIPVMQYGNINPEILIEGTDVDDAHAKAIGHIKKMFYAYSENGPLNENEIVDVRVLESFNEEGVRVNFDNIKHEYERGGSLLLSASQYTSKFSKKFDAQAVAKNCEKKWGIPAEVIQAMWKESNKTSTEFGTLVHRALEIYEKYRVDGNTVMKNADRPHPAIPKHPILSSIIEEFDKVRIGGDNVLSEVFITDIESGRCGQIDRLPIIDEEKKICRVQDFKVNIDVEEESSSNKLAKPFDTLPPNKLSKYTVQLSFYANMLKKSGWNVEGIDVYVYNGKWNVYKISGVDTP